MRVLLAAAVALALAGCQVDLEGAACQVPGSSGQCPSGQSCGNDLRCSTRAASCAGGPCTPGERRCVDGDVRTCVDADPVCGAWTVDVACAAGLECRGSGAAAACFCPANGGTEVVVDVEAGAPAGAPAPTGVRTPAQCRFASLEAGLAAARDGVAPVVVAAGAAATYHVTAPLAVPAGVTLQGDDVPPAPANRVLSLENGLSAGVTLAEGATLSGFTVQNDSAAAGAVGVVIACAAGTAVARLEDVSVQAAGASSSLANGVQAGGACPAELTRVTVQGASAAGLLVARDAAADTLLATDSTFDGNGEGVRITQGDVTLERAVVKGSAGSGVVADAGALLTVDQGSIRGNGDTGVVVLANPGRLRLTGTRVCGNGAKTLQGAPYTQRKVGGLYLFGNAPADLGLAGNALFGNGGDQVLVAGGSWALDGAPAGATACGPGVNLLGSYAPPEAGVTYVGLYAATAQVSALWNAWGNGSATPLSGRDYAVSGTGSVVAGEASASFCLSTPPACD